MAQKKKITSIPTSNADSVDQLINAALRCEGLTIPQTTEEVALMENKLKQTAHILPVSLLDPCQVFHRMMNSMERKIGETVDDEIPLLLAARIADSSDQDDEASMEYQKFKRTQQRKRGRK